MMSVAVTGCRELGPRTREDVIDALQYARRRQRALLTVPASWPLAGELRWRSLTRSCGS